MAAEVTDLHRLVRVAETSAKAVDDASAECADSKTCVECLKAMQDVQVTSEVRLRILSTLIASSVQTIVRLYPSCVQTVQLLQKTGFGPRVRRLRKHSHKGISAAATKVVSAWKEAITNEVSKESKTTQNSGAKASVPPRDTAAKPDACTAKTGSESSPNYKFADPPLIANSLRHKIRDTVGKALLEAVEGDDVGMTCTSRNGLLSEVLCI
jgi:hypothetical protein